MPLPPARIKEVPEDFVVEELPAYAPSGAGSHVFVRVTKTNVTTPDAVRALARALGCDPRAAGFAGMKDKRAVTTQTVSLEAPRGTSAEDVARRARELSLPGIVVHEATPHTNKLKPGHLAGNRFTIVLRGVPAGQVGEVEASLARIAREGVGNAFGAQRFGRDGDNAARALAWLTGKEKGPRDPRQKRFLWSALQSAVFNAVLEERRRDGTWATPLEGDLLKLKTGGLFSCADPSADRPRAEAGELSPTGPIVGDRMRWPDGVPGRLEREVTGRVLGADFDLSSTRRLGEGSRRALRLWVEGLRATKDGTSPEGATLLQLHFVLPKGAYATTVLSAAVDVEDGPSTSAEQGQDEEVEDLSP